MQEDEDGPESTFEGGELITLTSSLPQQNAPVLPKLEELLSAKQSSHQSVFSQCEVLSPLKSAQLAKQSRSKHRRDEKGKRSRHRSSRHCLEAKGIVEASDRRRSSSHKRQPRRDTSEEPLYSSSGSD